MKKIYAVKIGRQTGLFSTWPECEKQVKGYQGAKFKGFNDAQEALAWLAAPVDGMPPSQQDVIKEKSFTEISLKSLARNILFNFRLREKCRLYGLYGRILSAQSGRSRRMGRSHT